MKILFSGINFGNSTHINTERIYINTSPDCCNQCPDYYTEQAIQTAKQYNRGQFKEHENGIVSIEVPKGSAPIAKGKLRERGFILENGAKVN